MGIERQNIQLRLAFPEGDWGEAPGTSREGTEMSVAVCAPESPAEDGSLMEEVCERENLTEAIEASQSESREPRSGWDEGRGTGGVPEGALASHSGTVAGRELRTATCEAGRDTQAGRRGAQTRHPDRAGSLYPAGGATGLTEALGPDFLRAQLRLST